jgi:ribose-phosphate pyrophosphokinase
MGLVDDDLVVVSPDAGFAKRARQLAGELGRPVAIGDKIRTGHDENAKILEIIGDVKGKNCLIVDDFSISGGTLIDIAHGLKDKGAKRIYAALSHNVLNEKGIRRIDESPIEYLITTDTVECPEARLSNKIKIISAAPMFAQSVKIIHDRTPMSNLFKREFTARMLDMSFAEQTTMLKN